MTVTRLTTDSPDSSPAFPVIGSGGVYIVVVMWAANAPCDLAIGRIWDEVDASLSRPLLLGSIFAHMGGNGDPWGLVAPADVPPALRARIDAGGVGGQVVCRSAATTPLAIAEAAYVMQGEYRRLILTINGRETDLRCEPRPPMAHRGVVYLGDGFGNPINPDLVLEVPGEPVRPLRRCTRNHRVVALFDAFASACDNGTFQPGPVAIPE